MQTPDAATSRLVRLVALAAVLAGVAARFAFLDAPLFWQDEQYTSLYATGHSDREVAALFDGRPHAQPEVARFGRIEAGADAADVVAALRAEDPQHPPAFYLLEHASLEAIGSSIFDLRFLPACLGTLGIGLAYLLGRRLFLSPAGGAIAAAVFALSPVFVIYSRQAREYGLFIDDVLVASLALLAALEPGAKPWKWPLYSATLALGLYTHPLFTLVIAAHAVTAALEPGPRARRLAAFAAAAAAAIGAYLPWVARTVRENLDWAAVPYPLAYVVEKAGFNAGALVFDAEFRFQSLTPLAALCALAFLGACAVFAWTGGTARRFVVPLGASAIVAMGARDVVLHSHVSTIARYLTPSLVGLELALAGALAGGVASRSRRARATSLAALAGVLGLGAASALVRGTSPNWWDNNDQIPFQAVGAAIARAPAPLVYAATYLWIPRELALYVPRATRFVLFDAPGTRVSALPPLPNEDVFLAAPGSDVLARYRLMARGRYRVTNLSPSTDTLIGTFHRRVAREQKTIAARGVFRDLRPEESLFLFSPLRPASPARPASRRP